MDVLESDLLRSFIAVADQQNFTRAAETVGRTQSAISMQMKRLEEIVGSALFERRPRGVHLTRKGSELLINARRIVDLLDQTGASLRAPDLEGPVRIGIPEEYGASVISRAVTAFSCVHENVEVTVRHASSSAQRTALDRGELDLAVIFDNTLPPVGEVLMVDPTVWVTSDRHEIHEKDPIPVALYETPGWCTEVASRSLDKQKRPYRIAYRSDTSSGLRLAVSSGLAIAPLSRSNIPAGCRELGPSDGFEEIDHSAVVMSVGGKPPTPAVKAMASAIREVFADLR